jgi:phosphotransferase system HPr-like phosphotransfer protein
MADDSSSRASRALSAPGLSQAGVAAIGLNHWSVQAGLVVAAGLAAWMAWKHRRDLGRWLHLEYEVTDRVVVTDPHGFHMRRCADLVQVARKHITYNIHLRHHSAGGMTWASARSLMSLMSLGVRGPLKGQAPPVVEVRVHGLRPVKVLRQIRKILQERPEKYLSVYELAELAKQTGGTLVVRESARPVVGPSRWLRLVSRIGLRPGSESERTGKGTG